MTPYQQIDFVFFYIKDKEQFSASFSTEYIWNLYVSKTLEAGINRMIFDEIIKQLVADGYITELPLSDSPQRMYHVTFKGRSFNGYVEQQTILVENQKRLKALESANLLYQSNSVKNSRNLNYLTIILAIGTSIAAAYYILEILNHWICIYPKK